MVMIQQAAVDKHAQYSPVVETFAFSIVTAPLYRLRATSNTVSPDMFSEQLTWTTVEQSRNRVLKIKRSKVKCFAVCGINVTLIHEFVLTMM